MLQFAVTKERENRSASIDSHETKYGIEIIENGKTLKIFSDITYQEERINIIADLCNRCQVSPVHFDDVLENFLTDFEGF